MRAYLGYLLNQLLSHAQPLTKLNVSGIPIHSKHYQSLNGPNCLESIKGLLVCVKWCVCYFSLFRVFDSSVSLDPFIFLGKDSFKKPNQIKSSHIGSLIWILRTFVHFTHILNTSSSYLFMYLYWDWSLSGSVRGSTAHMQCLVHHTIVLRLLNSVLNIFIFSSVPDP